MNILHTSTPYRRDQPARLRVPVVLPLVQVRIDAEGLIDIVVDHIPYNPGAVLTRDALRQALDQIMAGLASPVKVEIHESDNAVFTDIMTPEEQGDAQSGPISSTSSAAPGEVGGNGFLPDEDVAVAIVVAHLVAKPDGTATLRLPPALLASRPGIVVLFGRTSGVVAVSDTVSGGAA